ncbi:PDDEXK-like family protein [Caballeronia sp. M23-90]
MKNLSIDPIYQGLLNLLYDRRAMALQARWAAFNPLRVLRADRYEIRHTNTLAWLLDAEGSHGMGDFFLRGFIKEVCIAADNSQIQFLYETSASRLVRVRREVQVETLNNPALLDDADSIREGEPIARKGRIDLLIEADRWAIAIEAKIDSNEGPQQLEKYAEKIKKWALKDKHLVLIYLTLASEDDPKSVNSSWINVTWSEAVAAPLRAALRIWRKTGGLGQQQYAFIASYLDILDDLSPDDNSPANRILNRLANDHNEVLTQLKNLGTKQPAGGSGNAEWRTLLERNKVLLGPLLRYVQSDVTRQADLIRSVVEKIGRPEDSLMLVAGNNTWIRFIPVKWREKFPWIYESDDPYLPRIVYEISNTRRGATIKLMICHLGEHGFGHEEFRNVRLGVLRKIQEKGLKEGSPFNRVFTKKGVQVIASPKVFSIMSQNITRRDRSDEEFACALQETLKQCVEETCNAIDPFLVCATQIAGDPHIAHIDSANDDRPSGSSALSQC